MEGPTEKDKSPNVDIRCGDPLLFPRAKEDTKVFIEDKCYHSQRQLVAMMTIMTVIFFLNFIGYFAMESMQSSINPEGGLGATAVALATFLIGAFSAFGSVIVQTLSPKWTIFVGSLGIVAFVAVNLYPTYIMLYTGSVAVGITDGPFFVAQAVYMAYICDRYSVITKKSLSQTLSIFCGIFQFVIGMSRPIAFIISAFVLKGVVHDNVDHINKTLTSIETMVAGEKNETARSMYVFPGQNELFPELNNKSVKVETDFSLCGANHCPYMDKHAEMLLQPDKNLIYVLMSSYTFITLLGLTMCLILRNIPAPRNVSMIKEVKSMFLMIKKDYILLLTFSFMTLGMVESMEASSFYPSFVSCTLGLGRLSYVMITEGFTVAMFALLSGFMVIVLPRYIQMGFAFTTNIVVGATWIIWQPSPEDVWIFFVLAIAQGCTVGIYRTQIQALLTELAGDKTGAAISIYFIYWFCTKGVVFAYSPFLCYAAKTYIYLTVICLGFVTYVIQEIQTRFVCKPNLDGISSHKL